MKRCYSLLDLDVHLEQSESKAGLFRVTYGLHVESGLDYVQAAHEFGECVFHALAWESKLDNEKD